MTGHFMNFSIETTAPIEPPSRTNTGSRPNANFTASRTASASGPVVGALYGHMMASLAIFTYGLWAATKSFSRRRLLRGTWFGTRGEGTITQRRCGYGDCA